jgi:uncharacterized membrane protein
MDTFIKLNANLLFALHVLLVFLLVFEESLVLPAWLQVAGRMHPLLLHLPIGFLVLLGILPVLHRELDPHSMKVIRLFLLHLATLSAVITALAGLWLSQEEGYAKEALAWHKWGGIAISFLSYGLLRLDQLLPDRRKVYYSVLGITLITLLITGHNGAVITHGEDFLLAPLRKKQVVITEDTPLFTAAVAPILQQKCQGCHNERKEKGGLIMTSREALLAGGENGPIWKAGDPENSTIIQRLQLPVGHDDHMPPEGKPQPTAQEIAIIHAWVAAGADLDKPLSQYPETDSLKVLASAMIQQQSGNSRKPTYDFRFASEKVIQRLNTPFRSVRPIAWNQPALQADIFVRAAYQPEFLEELSAVREQLISLDLSNLPVRDEDLATIAKFDNLEKLILNNTDITGAGIEALRPCRKLRSIGLSGTAVDETIMPALKGFDALEEVFVWNTRLAPEALEKMRNAFPDVAFVEGYIPDKSEILQLSPPLLDNDATVLSKDQPVLLKHAFPGVKIRYTADGSTPDSLSSPLYETGIALDSFTELKAKAFLDGWKSSETASFVFFKKEYTPESIELLHPPAPEYKGEGASTLTDGLKGDAGNFRVPLWLGFREHPMAALACFGENPPVITHITLSYAQNMGPYLMPPSKVEIWAGNDPEKLKLIDETTPPPPSEYQPNQVKGIDMAIPPSSFSYYKIVGRPIAKLPDWHSGKGERAWLFVDEVFFY